MSWRGISGGIEAAKMNHEVIMTPNAVCYLDHYQAKDTKNEPLAIGGYTPIEEIYNYEPIPSELDKSLHKYIIGAQGNVWTEYMKTSDHVEYMVFQEYWLCPKWYGLIIDHHLKTLKKRLMTHIPF